MLIAAENLLSMVLCSTEEDLRGQTDEDQVTDSEICTITATRLDSEKKEPAADLRSDSAEG